MNTQRNAPTPVSGSLNRVMETVRANEGSTSTEIWNKMSNPVQPSVLTHQLQQLFESGHLTRRWLGNAYGYFIARRKRA